MRHGDREGAWRPRVSMATERGMATASEHGDREGAWRPRGSPLLYDVYRPFSCIVVATLAVAMLTRGHHDH